MLPSILTGKHPSSIVCIQDSLKQSGVHVLKAFAQQAINTKENHVHILCYEYPTKRMRDGLRNSNEDHVHIYDCFTDHRGWNERFGKERVKSELHGRDNGILFVLQSSSALSTNGCIVIIDSLTPPIFNIGMARCYRELHSLLLNSVNGLNVLQVIFLVHEDTLPNADIVLSQLHHLSTSCIRICPPTQTSKGKPIASIIHKKQGGKVLKQDECYSVDTDNRLKSEDLVSLHPPAKSNEVGDDNDLPLDLTTFKLSLGQQEKQARSELVLPYLRVDNEKGGKVFYQPDAADDWDEEDPDDDLDV